MLISIFTYLYLRFRSFKGANRKRPRTETTEGAAEVKKDEKEEKEVNGENKESTQKENIKDSDKKNETTVKSSGESSSEGSALSIANEIKGRLSNYCIFKTSYQLFLLSEPEEEKPVSRESSSPAPVCADSSKGDKV